MPRPTREKSTGSHALLVCGYDHDARVFRVRNSWGPDWGDAGYGTIPYAYALDKSLAGSLWTAVRET
jgi:C1A family cysteine protease